MEEVKKEIIDNPEIVDKPEEAKSKKKDKKTIFKKTMSIIGNVFLYIFMGLGVISMVFTIMGKKGGSEGVSMFGHQFMTVLTASMEKCDQTDVSGYEIKDIPVKSLICVENVPTDEKAKDDWYASIKVGDVLTFKYMYFEQEIITHRVVEARKNINEGYTFVLEGDNKAEGTAAGQQIIDTSLTDSFNYVIGKVVWTSYALGNFFTILRSPVGITFVVIVPCAIIFIYELFKIILYIHNFKKEKLVIDSKAKDAEIEELKKRLLEIEKDTDEKKEG